MSSYSKTKKDDEPIIIGSKRQLFFDDLLLESYRDVSFSIHHPTSKEAVIRCDNPWGKKIIHYPCVFADENRFRMWYRVDSGSPNKDTKADNHFFAMPKAATVFIGKSRISVWSNGKATTITI